MNLRSIISPPGDIVPNDNTPEESAPGTVGPDQLVTPGDPHGVTVTGEGSSWVPPTIIPSAWSGWPGDWWTPQWQSRANSLTDTAWICVDKNSWILSEMTPYLV